MKHSITNYTLTDLERRIASPLIQPQAKEEAITELARRNKMKLRLDKRRQSAKLQSFINQ